AFVSASGDWPLFASLNSGTGLLLGRVALTNQPESDLQGQLSWFQSPRASAKTYPAGFALTNGPRIVGGLYTFAKGVPLLNLTNRGVAFLESGNLPQSILNSFTLDTNNRVASPDGLTVRITTSSGLFKGTVFNPVTRHRIAIQGALLLKRNAGFGQ